MKKMLMVVMACYAFTARSQVDQSKNFIYLFSDSIIYAKDVSLRPDYFDSWQLRADRRRVPAEQVKFVNNEDGFFANTRKLTYSRVTTFSERTIEGKINLFKEIIYNPERHDWRYRHYPERRNQSVDISNYYNKGYNDLKKVNYNNLKTDMADHVQSMDLLKGYKKSMTTRTILYSAGVASFIAGVASFISSSDSGGKILNSNFMNGSPAFSKGPNYLPAALFFGAGLGFGIGGFYVHVSGTRKLEGAIEAYNR